MSIISNLIKKADENNGYASCGGFGNSILNSIELGTLEGHYHASKEEMKPRKIEVWLHLKRPINADECSEFYCILENNDIFEDEIECNGLYDYHLPFFSVAWLEDIYPKLVSTTMPIPKQPTENLVEFALNHGCDVLDMTTMTIISHK